MKKVIFSVILIISFITALTASVMAEKSLNLIKARGNVNLQDIGGKGLYVFSLWDKNKGFPITKDGTFETIISDSMPQKLSVRDEKNMTRALTIALPEDPESIVFDAKSTASAILFQDPNLLTNSAEVENLYKKITDKESFQGLVIFFQKNLPYSSLEELTDNKECIALLEKCNSEIFGQDTQAIKKSLYDAQRRLQELFKENGAHPGFKP